MTASHAARGRTSRLGALDALRFLAAFSVLSFHFTGITPGWDGRAPHELDGLGRWASYGTMGVPLFFVISGFVILMTAWGRDIPQFVASRVSRLFPAYWTAVAIAAVFSFVLWPTGSVLYGHAPTKVQALLNLTMFHSAFGAFDLDGPYWTLWSEARFYLLLAFFMLVGITRQRVMAFASLWPVVAAVAAQTGQHLIATLLISDYAPYFAGGMLLYVIYRDGHDFGTWLLVGMQSLFAVYFAVGHYPDVIAASTGWPPSKTLVAAISFACFGLVGLVSLTPLGRTSARWMTSLGALTYPLYLVHERVGLYFIHVLHAKAAPWVAVAVATAAALTLAALIHYLVERPLSGRMRAAMLTSLRRKTDAHRSPTPIARGDVPHQLGHPVHAAAAPRTHLRPAPGARPPTPAAAHD